MELSIKVLEDRFELLEHLVEGGSVYKSAGGPFKMTVTIAGVV